MNTLTLRRTGEFNLRVAGDHHCGVVPLHQTEPIILIKYEFSAVCSTVLDHRGFLFEQRNVDAYFQSLRRTTRSCEQLVQGCLRALLGRIMGENPSCHIIAASLTLSPAPHAASMTYDWSE